MLFLMAAVLGSGQIASGAGLLTSFAAGGSVTPLSKYDEETMTRFADQILEYREIPGLIEHYNPAYLNELETYYYNPDGSTGLSRDQLTWLAESLRNEASILEDELDEMLDAEEIDKKSTIYEEYQENIKTLKRRAREMETALKGSSSTKRLLRIAKSKLTVEISGDMRSYQKLISQHAIQMKNLEIAELVYESAKRQAEIGLYSAAQVTAAEQSLNLERAKTDASAAELAKVKSDLITAFGWGYNANPEICPIPEPDLTKIAAYQLAADTEQAVSYSFDMADVRSTDASEYGSARKKLQKLSETEDSVRIQMEVLYKTVLAKEESYQGAQNGWQAAEHAKAQAERKYALGMISRMEFLQAEAAWLTEKASWEQANLDLLEAMEAYEWAMNGLIIKSSGM